MANEANRLCAGLSTSADRTNNFHEHTSVINSKKAQKVKQQGSKPCRYTPIFMARNRVGKCGIDIK